MATGCSSGGMSLASMNPFSKSATPTETQPSGVTATLASTASGAGKQVSNLGSSAKKAWSKTTGAVAGIFKAPADESEEIDVTDPLSLSTKPEKVGPEVFVANGQLWESTGDFTKAMESYTKALESEPSHAPALTSIARLHFRQGNHKQAADYFQRAIAKEPNDAGLHNDLGLTLNKLGDHAGASQHLEKALELAPGTSRYANNLASIKFEAGDANGAFQVLSMSNKPAVAHFNMAYLYFKNGKLTAAREHLSQVMKYESLASNDVAIQRAVERTRDMLAQINTATAPIAQAAPQAQIAAGSGFTGGKTVQQTSQTEMPKLGIQPGATFTPASTPVAPASTPVAPASTPVAPATTTSPTAGTSSGQASQPTIPFSLPSGFGSSY